MADTSALVPERDLETASAAPFVDVWMPDVPEKLMVPPDGMLHIGGRLLGSNMP